MSFWFLTLPVPVVASACPLSPLFAYRFIWTVCWKSPYGSPLWTSRWRFIPAFTGSPGIVDYLCGGFIDWVSSFLGDYTHGPAISVELCLFHPHGLYLWCCVSSVVSYLSQCLQSSRLLPLWTVRFCHLPCFFNSHNSLYIGLCLVHVCCFYLVSFAARLCLFH